MLSSQSESAFFGLTPEYRVTLHKQIFDLIYYGKGGFNWSDVYEMPIWLRIFYIRSINDALKAEAKANEKANQKARQKTPKRPVTSTRR
jgi:hypothetical protein